MVPKTTATSMRPPSFGMADHGTFWSKPPTPTLFLEWPCCMATTYTYGWWRGAVLSSNHYRKQYRDGPAEQRHGADCLQRPLRSRFRQRLMPSVRGAADKAAHLVG